MGCSQPGSSVHGILRARILEWVAIPPPGIFPTQGLNLHLQAGRFFTTTNTTKIHVLIKVKRKSWWILFEPAWAQGTSTSCLLWIPPVFLAPMPTLGVLWSSPLGKATPSPWALWVSWWAFFHHPCPDLSSPWTPWREWVPHRNLSPPPTLTADLTALLPGLPQSSSLSHATCSTDMC